MKKIWTKSVFEYNKKTKRYEVNENESQYHLVPDDAPMQLMKGSSDESSRTTTTNTIQNSEPWKGVQPYLTSGYAAAVNQFSKPIDYSFTPDSLAAQEMQRERAMNGSPLNRAAGGLLTDTLNGKYLYGGEGFNAALDAANRKIMPQVNSTFERSGRAGSGLASTAETQAMSDAFANLYEQERQNQINAANLAPVIANQDYVDASKLSEVGSQIESRRMEEQNQARNDVERFLRLIQGGNTGGTTTGTTSQIAPETGLTGWPRYLSGAASGGLIGYSYGGAPGAIIGSGLGLLGAY